MILSIAIFLVLSIPTVYELLDDWRGETLEQKKKDVRVRAFLMIVCSAIVAALMTPEYRHQWVTSENLWPLTLVYIKALVMSFAIFFLTFDYSINLILGRKPWYSYLSKSPMDRLAGKVDWRIRMGIRVVIFTAALIWFLA